MSLIGTWRDAWQNFNNNLGDSAGELTSQVGAQVCKLYRKYPNSWLISSFGRGYLNAVCPPLGENPPPSSPPPIQGGQCPGVQYRIEGNLELTNISNCNVFNDPFSAVVVTGAITSFEFIGDGQVDPVNQNCGGGVGYRGGFWVNHQGGTTQITQGHYGTAPNSAGVNAGLSNLNSLTVTRLDGLPDNCGNLPPTLPPNEPFDPADVNIDITVNTYDTTGAPTGNVTFNVEFDSNQEFEFPLNLTINDTDFNFNYEGLDGSDNPIGDGNTTNIYNDRRTFNENVYREVDRPPTPDETPDADDGTQDEEVLDNTIEFVLLTVTTLPRAGKTILQSNSENNDYFAGYFSWILSVGGQTYYSPQTPVRKQRSYFKAPQEVMGYRYWAVNGAKIKAQTYNVTN